MSSAQYPQLLIIAHLNLATAGEFRTRKTARHWVDEVGGGGGEYRGGE